MVVRMWLESSGSLTVLVRRDCFDVAGVKSLGRYWSMLVREVLKKELKERSNGWSWNEGWCVVWLCDMVVDERLLC